MIKLNNVNKYYNRHKKNEIHVINNTTLDLPQTGLICLLGPSGCGKTTLLNAIGGLEKVNKGNIYINDKKITHKRMNRVDKIRNLNIGYIFQDYKLIDNLTVFDNVAIVLKVLGIKDKEEIKKRVNYVLETLNIYRYRNRYAGALSGGERQRVGIARAIVKDPNILLADEPTGNLDSKNTLEIMNIIKSISKTRLVILVTHEVKLAHFYASRIIEIEDGSIIKDYENRDAKELDYQLENNIYLKDMKIHEQLTQKDNIIDLFSEQNEKINLTIVIRHGNIYLKSNNNNKIEVIDQNSNIELINDHYKKLDYSEIEKYEFNFKDIINKKYPKKYSSILNPISLLINGFKKIHSYSAIKKFLLLGYLAASMFIVFSISRIMGAKEIKNESFINDNLTYLEIKNSKLDVDKYNNITNLETINYAFPGKSVISFQIKYNTLIQNYNMSDDTYGSLSSLELINENNLIYGRMPNEYNEVVIDKMIIKKILDNDFSIAKMVGINTVENYLDLKIIINEKEYQIVGITDLDDPSIYTSPNNFVKILYNSYLNMNYNLYQSYDNNELKLKKGKLPVNDYEALINYDLRYMYSIGQKLDNKINGNKLKVVGYYESQDQDIIYVNNNMLKYELINNETSITISTNNKTETINELHNKNLTADDLYEIAKTDYINENKDNIRGVIIFSSIIIGISLIEILLMVRSSFLSRIKEVGIYRAIGVKKSDIYKMFLGEILAISLTASLIGNIFMSYIIYNLNTVKLLKNLFIINYKIIIIAYLICLGFNILVGLIPVMNTIRKRPAQILARNDV